jgi:hypothetical protein
MPQSEGFGSPGTPRGEVLTIQGVSGGTPIAISGAGSGGTSAVDDAAFAAASGSGTPAMGYVTADSVDSGDVGVLGMLANRQLKVTLFDSGGSELAVGGGTQYTEDAVAAANPIGNAIVVVRDDARGGALTTLDGDNVALRGTNAGEVYVKHVDAIPVTDNGGVLTVDGTVAVTNAGLTALNGAITGTEVQVDVLTLPNVTIGAALPAGTNNIGDVDVLTLPALVAGAAEIGRVRITDGTDLLDILDLTNSNPAAVAIVDANGDQITSFGGGTQYTEDAAAAANPVATALNLVRDDARGGALTTTDGDNVAARGTNAGELYVKHVDAIAVTNAGLTELAAAVQVDDAAFAPATGSVLMVGAEFDDAAPDSVDEGDGGALRMSANRSLYVNLRDNAGNERGLNIDAGGALAATQSGTWNVGTVTTVTTVAAVTAISNALPAGNNNIGDVDVASVVPGTGATNLGKAIDTALGATDTGVLAMGVRDDALAALTEADGDVTVLRTNSRGAQWVVPDGNVTVVGTGTLAVQVDGAALTALQLIDDPVLVDDAAFTPAASSVMMAGFQADETATDSVSEGDAGAARMSLDRKLYAIAHAETGSIYQNGTARTPAFAVIDAAASGDNTLLASQGASNKIRVLSAFLVASGTVNVRFESGTAGTALTGQMNLIANTGFVLPYSPTGWFETAADTLLNLELSAGVSVDGSFTYIVVT